MTDRRAGLRDWPNRDSSRTLRAGGFGWHVQTMGQGPTLLLLHGTGAATHSWRGLAPILARRFTVVAPDLPGHGLTETPASSRMSLPGMAGAVRSLLQILAVKPDLVAGHSAGAAIALRMTLDGAIQPVGVIGLNAALRPFGGAAGKIFSPLARILVGLPVLPNLFAWRASSNGVVAKLLADTGSKLGPEAVAAYARVVRDPRHNAAALTMMASWDLQPLVDDLPRLKTPLLLLAANADRTIPPSVSEEIVRIVPGAQLKRVRGGHLAHEEFPAETAADIEAFATTLGVL